MKKIIEFLFGKWSKWQHVSCTESIRYHTLIQVRINLKTGKKRLER